MPLSFFRSPAKGLPELKSTAECDALMDQKLTVIFKHSPSCSVSWMAHREVMDFCNDAPDIPVYLISVRLHRDVARHVEACTGVRHESPQVLVLRDGKLVGATSHDGVTAEWLSLHVAKCW